MARWSACLAVCAVACASCPCLGHPASAEHGGPASGLHPTRAPAAGDHHRSLPAAADALRRRQPGSRLRHGARHADRRLGGGQRLFAGPVAGALTSPSLIPTGCGRPTRSWPACSSPSASGCPRAGPSASPGPSSTSGCATSRVSTSIPSRSSPGDPGPSRARTRRRRRAAAARSGGRRAPGAARRGPRRLRPGHDGPDCDRAGPGAAPWSRRSRPTELARELDALRGGQRSCTAASVSVGRPVRRTSRCWSVGSVRRTPAPPIDQSTPTGWATPVAMWSGSRTRAGRSAPGRRPGRPGSISVHSYGAGRHRDRSPRRGRRPARRPARGGLAARTRRPHRPARPFAGRRRHAPGLGPGTSRGPAAGPLGLVVTIATPHQGSDGRPGWRRSRPLLRAAPWSAPPSRRSRSRPRRRGHLARPAVPGLVVAAELPDRSRLGSGSCRSAPAAISPSRGSGRARRSHLGPRPPRRRVGPRPAPSAPAATRAITLALAGRAPACVGVAQRTRRW